MKRTICIMALMLLTNWAAPPVFAGSAEQNTYARFMKSGSDLLQAGSYESAREAFSEALRYNESDPAVYLGLGLAYFHLREDRAAERELLKVIELNPRSADAHALLGELSYRGNDLDAAVSYWERAVALNPTSGELRARLERIQKEHRTERDFNHDVTSHFFIKYEGREKIEAGRIILRILEDAYGEIGRSLSFYPDREIQVILYSAKQFQEVTDAPGWSGGIYDGKIRIPIGGIEKETPGLRKLLYHEYTHAVVRALSPRCPVWLNEGLAQYFEGREIEEGPGEAIRKLARAGKLPSLRDLEGSFTGLNGNQAAFAYLFSLSSVRYMIDTFGLYRVRTLLDELAAGANTATAVDRAIMISYEEFEREWKESLE